MGDEYVRTTIRRLGKNCGALIDALERGGGFATVEALAAALHKTRTRDLRRRTSSGPSLFLAGRLVEAAQRVNEVLELLLFLESELPPKVATLQAAVATEIRPGLAGGWVRVGCGRVIHVNSSDLLAAPPGD